MVLETQGEIRRLSFKFKNCIDSPYHEYLVVRLRNTSSPRDAVSVPRRLDGESLLTLPGQRRESLLKLSTALEPSQPISPLAYDHFSWCFRSTSVVHTQTSQPCRRAREGIRICLFNPKVSPWSLHSSLCLDWTLKC